MNLQGEAFANTRKDSILLKAVETMGRNWSDIVNRHFSGRSALSAKNRYSLLHRRIENTRVAPKADDGFEASPAPSASPSSSSLSSLEDSGLDMTDMEFGSGDISLNIDHSQSIATDNQGTPFDFDSNVILGLTTPQTSQPPSSRIAFPTPTSILTPASHHTQPEHPTVTSYGYNNDEGGYFDNLCGLNGEATSAAERHTLTESSSKEIVIRVQCRSDQTEMVMEGLSKVVNGMMVQGGVKDVNFHIT